MKRERTEISNKMSSIIREISYETSFTPCILKCRITNNIFKKKNNKISFDAKLELLFNKEYGCFLDFRIKIKKCCFRNKQQNSWRNSIYEEIREQIYNLPSFRGINKNCEEVYLNIDQVKELSSFFNSFRYESTLNQLYGIIRGRNTKGVIKQYWSADVVINEEDILRFNACSLCITKIYEMFSLSKKEWMAFRNNESYRREIWERAYNLNEIYTFNEYLDINDKKIISNKDFYINTSDFIKRFLDETDQFKREIIEQDIKRKYKDLLPRYSYLKKEINIQLNKLNKTINNKGGKDKLFMEIFPNNVVPCNIENAHIISKKIIIMNYMANKKGGNLSDIGDINNIIPLDPNMHKAFDNITKKKPFIYWDKNGFIRHSKEFKNIVNINYNMNPDYLKQNKKFHNNIIRYLDIFKDYINE